MGEKFFLIFSRNLSGFNASSFLCIQTLREKGRIYGVFQLRKPSHMKSSLLSLFSVSLMNSGSWRGFQGHRSPLLVIFNLSCEAGSLSSHLVKCVSVLSRVNLLQRRREGIISRLQKKTTYFYGMLLNPRHFRKELPIIKKKPQLAI